MAKHLLVILLKFVVLLAFLLVVVGQVVSLRTDFVIRVMFVMPFGFLIGLVWLEDPYFMAV
jgi:hypothetical protein